METKKNKNCKQNAVLILVMMICYILVPICFMWCSLPVDMLTGLIYSLLFMTAVGVGQGIVCAKLKYPFVMNIIGIIFMIVGVLLHQLYPLWLLTVPGGALIASSLITIGIGKIEKNKRNKR